MEKASYSLTTDRLIPASRKFCVGFAISVITRKKEYFENYQNIKLTLKPIIFYFPLYILSPDFIQLRNCQQLFRIRPGIKQ
jgi:hypothetical protein